jgi:hypothetical protein
MRNDLNIADRIGCKFRWSCERNRRAASIVQAISGFPANILIFLLGKRFEEPRAGITPSTFGFIEVFLEFGLLLLKKRLHCLFDKIHF